MSIIQPVTVCPQEQSLLFKEKYNNIETNLYVKPAEQDNIVIFNDSKRINKAKDFFVKLFLPSGYPNSVSEDYAAYQIYDTAQAFCSTFTGILATQQVMKGLGVGDDQATAYGATITWILKTTSGQLGGILFSFTHGCYLDSYSKKWRLIADISNDLAICLEMALPLFSSLTPIVLCFSSGLKAIVGVAGSATKSAMVHHHALRGNTADVSAKDCAQETVVNLISSFVTVLLMPILPFPTLAFLVMIILHLFFNYLAVSSVCLKTLNDIRYLQVIEEYLNEKTILSPRIVNSLEPLKLFNFGHHMLDVKLCGFQIKIGKSMRNVMCKQSKESNYWALIKSLYEDKSYVLFPHNGTLYMYVKEMITVEETLLGYFNAVVLSLAINVLDKQPLASLKKSDGKRRLVDICASLDMADWSRTKSGNSYELSYHFYRYINSLVTTEWPKFYDGLIKSDWDLSKHVLVVDEWRLSEV